MTQIAVFFVIAFTVFVIRKTLWRELKIRWYGIEADAVVSRIEDDDVVIALFNSEHRDRYPQYSCYAVFRTPSGLENESRLLNPKKGLTVGSRIKVRYLPSGAACAVLTQTAET